jgi:hypothetical protein
MQDRELLELAAKAATMDVEPLAGSLAILWHMTAPDEGQAWNPLADDGDALRLAGRLRLSIMRTHGRHEVQVSADDGGGGGGGEYCAAFALEPDGDDPYAATRRAIVRAAAELGKA